MPVLLRKLLSPAGFLLALLFFLLPFVTVSCDTGTAGKVSASYTGFDLATGRQPGIEATGSLNAKHGGPVHDGDRAPDAGVQVFAILAAAALAAGVGTAALRSPRLRHLGAAGAAVVAGSLLVVTELVALSRLEQPVRAVVEAQFPGTPDNLGPALSDALHTRGGFWLALGTLIVVLVANIAVAVRAWMRQ